MKSPLHNRRGLGLLEVSMGMLLLSIGLPAVAYMYSSSLTVSSQITHSTKAQFLADSLINEISARRFRESLANPGNAPLAGQINGFSRLLFNDVGDYNYFKTTWGALSPPRDEAGNQLTDYPDFSQYVEVYNIPPPGMGPAVRSLTAVADGSSDFKVATVTISWDKGHSRIAVSKIFVLP